MALNLKALFFNVLILLFAFGCSTDADAVVEGEILGQWQVTAIHDSSPSGPTLGPGSGEIISITFETDGKFSGSTSVNSFKGSFSATDETLVIQAITTTEVADTNFGDAFYRSFNESRDSNTGFSEFTIDFQNENTLNLEYQGFKFLTLQK